MASRTSLKVRRVGTWTAHQTQSLRGDPEGAGAQGRALLTSRADAVEDYFGVGYGVAGFEMEGANEVFGDFGGLEAFDFAAGFADEMGVAVLVGFFGGVASGVAPGAIFAADSVHEMLAGEGVQRAVDGDGIGGWGQLGENRGDIKRRGGFG